MPLRDESQLINLSLMTELVNQIFYQILYAFASDKLNKLKKSNNLSLKNKFTSRLWLKLFFQTQ